MNVVGSSSQGDKDEKAKRAGEICSVYAIIGPRKVRENPAIIGQRTIGFLISRERMHIELTQKRVGGLVSN